jgi:putative DNA primase/helicase
MVSLAAHSPKLVRRADQLDRDPMLLNCLNGTVELGTGQLRQHQQADLLTKLAPVEFAAQARCPRWLKFLGEIFDNKPELIAFMQRLLGYCLTGKVDLHVLPIFWGSGANGKSTLLNTILAILGVDYASGLPRDLLLHHQFSGHPTGLWYLKGKRLTAAQETGEGRRLNEALLKQLTGADRITARPMRTDFSDFDPTHKIILSTNHRP